MNYYDDLIDLDEVENNVMMELKDFQRATVNRIDELFSQDQNRILVSDEVGLGKTLIARGVIAKFIKLRKKEKDDLVKVVYICSNAAIAQQNLNKLRIADFRIEDSNTSRLSMQHINIFNEEFKKKSEDNDDSIVTKDYIQLIPLTPQTSFKITNSQGLAEERALIYSVLKLMDDLKEYDKQLSQFLSFDVNGWDQLILCSDKKVRDCIKNSGHEYYFYMVKELSKHLDEKNIHGRKLMTELIRYLKKGKFEQDKEARNLIIELRRIFTKISIDRLNPDLIIMDEFQRFKYLLDSDRDSDIGALTEKFFNPENLEDTNDKLRILLLSATPYKMYSTLEEINDAQLDEHYKEFLDVINFLNTSEEDKNNFKTIWSNYSMKLKEISKDRYSFIIAKNKAENALYKNICRTERIAETHTADIIDDNDKKNLLEVFKEDINSYRKFVKLLKNIDIKTNSVPIDYIKSSPYLMSFMDNYQLKEKIKKYFKENPKEISKLDDDIFWINKSDIDNYQEIPFNHARLNHLMDNIFKDKAEFLLWVPPSKEYYHSEGIFKGTNNFSKTLVFSSWEMVPRMISTLVSYEVERRTIGLFSSADSSIKYFKLNKSGYKYAYPRIENLVNKSGRLSRKVLFSLVYPSSYLSMVYVPIECLNNNLSLRKIEKLLKSRIEPQLKQFKEEQDSYDNSADLDEDYRWYCIAPLLLDCLEEKSKKESEEENPNLEWYSCTEYVENWFNKFKEHLKNQNEKDKKNRKGFEEYITHLEETFNAIVYYAKNNDEFVPQYHKGSNNIINKLGRKPADLLDVLVDMAIASPANCIYRSYRRELSSYADLDLTISNDNSEEYFSNELLKEALAKEMKKYAHLCSKLAFNFLYVMNSQEAMAAIDYLYGNPVEYWKNILTYCKQGNLQAVFDEYVNLLSNGLDKKNEKRLTYIHERFLGSMGLNTTSNAVDTFDIFKSEVMGEKKEKMRLSIHFAVPFTKGPGNAVDTNRKTSVRDAFNSPFRPFVVASTSIGQEGLDFHNYCRRIVHWNLPSNPIDLEQREGRINRFACLAIRQNIAKRYGKIKFKNNIWIEMFDEASRKESPKGVSDLIPFWGLRDPKDIECMEDKCDMIKIERILPFYPFSIDEERYDRLINILSVYRLTLGQPRQEELAEHFLGKGKLPKEYFINLSPYFKKTT